MLVNLTWSYMANKLLASELRPHTLKDIIGQSHLLTKDALITRMVANQHTYSLIFYGPPGIGKTSLAIALANDLHLEYAIFNSTTDKKEDLVSKIQQYKDVNFVLIIEEIHRLNRDKQDILLSHLENGSLYIFATTTENPYFIINPAVRSRCQIQQLKPIESTELATGLRNLIIRNHLQVDIDDEILTILANQVNGDLRVALNFLDIFINLYSNEIITRELLAQVMMQPIVLGSHYGDEIHDLKSAFHKSLRGSDVDASLYYLARLIKLEALQEISRRMIAVAYEDVGMASPNTGLRVSAGMESVFRVGLPEAINILGVLCVELATAPKSNAASAAIHQALTEIDQGQVFPIPNHIRDQNYASAAKLGNIGYLYPHNFPNNYVKQTYLPTKLQTKVYYHPPLTSEHEQKLIK